MRPTLTVLVLFCTFAGVQAAGQTGVFVEPPQYAVGKYSTAVAVGDFNGDGKPDLAVLNVCAAYSNNCNVNPLIGTVSILLGNGDGTFETQFEYPVGQYPTSVAVGDFNGDGKLDLAVTNSTSQTVSVLFGNGDGTFQAKVDYGTGLSPSSLAVGDFNGDGKLDLAVANSQDNSVSIFLNSGTGTFAHRQDFVTGFAPTSVAVGVFSGNQNLDVVVTSCGNSQSCYNSPGAVSVLLGNGDGTLQAPVNYLVGNAPAEVVVADLNGDGILDLAVVNDPYLVNPIGSVSVLFGNGNGTFQSQQVYSAGNSPSSIVVADFNGDGQLDFGVINAGDDTVGVYLNQGHGVFSLPTLLYGAGGVAVAGGATVVADFNQDLKTDIAVLCGSYYTNSVCILLGNGQGAFSGTPVNYATGTRPISAAVDDLNGDGKNDVVVANEFDSDVGVFLGNGDGTFQAPVTYSTDTFPNWVAVADLNGDGKPDLVTANQAGTVSVLLNNGNGTFQAHVDYATIGPASFVAIGDVNGDGKPDLVVTCPGSNAVSILLGNGDGTFQPHTDFGVGAQPTSVALGDFNGDGKLDLAVANANSGTQEITVSVLLNNGNGTFSEHTVTLQTEGNGISYAAIATADVNGDGRLDLAVSGVKGGYAFSAVLLGNGDGTFQPPSYYTGVGGAILALADFSNNGNLDIAIGQGDGVILLLGNGDGTFQGDPTLYAAAKGGAIAGGDLNGDGKPDLAVANGGVPGVSYGNNLLTILLNAGHAAPSFKLAVSPASQTVSAGNSTSFTVTATTSNGFNSSVSLTCTGQPSGATCTLNPASVIPTANGATATATVTTSASTPVGTYTLAITGTSGSEQFTVNPGLTVKPAPPDYSVSAPSSTTPSSVTPGQSATAMVTAGSTGGFAGTVAFSCTVSPTPSLAPVCSMNPAQAPLTSGGQATSTLTVTTTAATAFLSRPIFGRGYAPVFAIVFPVLGLALAGIGLKPGHQRKGKLLGFAICSLLLGGLIFQAACGGSSGSTGMGTPGTPAGSYTVTVTASSGSTQHTTAVKFTVQ